MNTYATKTERKFQTTTEVAKVNKNIVLEGVDTLWVTRFLTTFEAISELNPKTNQILRIVSRKRIDENEESLRFPLIEVTLDALADYRQKGVPSFVLKIDGRLYYTAIPENLSLVSSTLLGAHRCAVAGRECKRLSSAIDEEGGCQKVRNHARYIERYPWITTGYETFNTERDAFVVINCSHYEKCPPRKPPIIAPIS